MDPNANQETGAEGTDDPRADLANLLNNSPEVSGDATTDGEGEQQTENTDEGDQQTDPQAQAEPEYTVKVDGREFKVKQSELINGYQRDSDYRAKTMALAEERRAVEQAKTASMQRVQQLDDALAQVISRLEVEVQESPDLIKLLDTNPQEYLKQRHALETKRAELAQARIAQNAMREQAQQEHHENMRRYVEAEAAKLVQALPEWKDEAKAKAEKGQLAEYLKGYGFTPEQLNQLTDHRDVLIARKAMLYDQLLARKPEVTKKVTAAPARAESSGASTGTDRSKPFQDAMRRLNRSGSREDGRAAIKALLG